MNVYTGLTPKNFIALFGCKKESPYGSLIKIYVQTDFRRARALFKLQNFQYTVSQARYEQTSD